MTQIFNFCKYIFIVASEKGAMVAVQLLITVILTCLLTPDDFGLIGMLAIFIALGNTLVGAVVCFANIYSLQ